MIGNKTDIIKWVLDEKGDQFECRHYHPKRTLTQNSYFHKLVSLIAAKVRSSDSEVKNHLLSEYGVIDTDAGTILIEDGIPWNKSPYIHIKPTSNVMQINGKLFRVCFVMKGSHELDTSEMTRLVDGTVEEAKALGIETMPDRELKRLREYDEAKSRKCN